MFSDMQEIEEKVKKIRFELMEEPGHEDEGKTSIEQGKEAALKLLYALPGYIESGLLNPAEGRDTITLCKRCYANIKRAAIAQDPAAMLIMKILED